VRLEPLGRRVDCVPPYRLVDALGPPRARESPGTAPLTHRAGLSRRPRLTDSPPETDSLTHRARPAAGLQQALTWALSSRLVCVP
jgi:hypothetical protein